jgi:hypothetical protein
MPHPAELHHRDASKRETKCVVALGDQLQGTGGNHPLRAYAPRP